jgi:hypothetical protein
MAITARLSGREVIWLVRGLSFVLGGLFTALAGAVLTQLPWAEVWTGRLLWLLTAGAWLIVFGAGCLQRMATPGLQVKAAAQRCLWLALVTAFLSPFAYFWYRAPWRDYLTANVLLLVICGVCLLLCLSRLALRLGEFLRDETLALVARISGWLCHLTLVFPLAAVLLGIGIGSWREQLPLLGTMSHLLDNLSPLAKAMALAPACFMAALLWTLKAVGLAQIENLDKHNPPARAPQAGPAMPADRNH